MSLQSIRDDVKRILNSGGFETACTFKDLSVTPVIKTINALVVAHHMSLTQDGSYVNAKTVRLTFCEKELTDTGYTVRVSGLVKLQKHKVTFADATGVAREYIISETMPDDTLGLITCTLHLTA